MDYVALARLAGNDGRIARLPFGQEGFEISHQIATLFFGRLMTSHAIRLKNGIDVFGETNRCTCVGASNSTIKQTCDCNDQAK